MHALKPPLLRGSFFLVASLFTLACAGFGDVKTEEAPVVEAAPPVGAVSWEVTRQDEQDLVKAGTGQGLTIGTQIVLLGPALAGTEARQIVGSGAVVEVWPDLSRVTAERVKQDSPEPSAARLYLPEDQAALDLIPLVGDKGGKGGRRPAAAAEFSVDQVPDPLKSGSPESRMDALVRFETDTSMTQAIIWVLKNDSNSDVQFKAWRVVRARWKRGTGSAAAHEAAAGWVAQHRGDDARVEALDAFGELGRSLTVPRQHLANSAQNVRVAAAKAVYDIGSRTDKRAEAKKLLQDRREVEPVVGVRNKLGNWIAAL